MKLYRAVYVGKDPALTIAWAQNGFCVAQDFGEMCEIVLGEEYLLVPKKDVRPLLNKEKIPFGPEYSEPLVLPPKELVDFVDGKDVEWLLENTNGFTIEQVSAVFIWLGRLRFHSRQNKELSPNLLSAEWEYARKGAPIFMKLIEQMRIK